MKKLLFIIVLAIAAGCETPDLNKQTLNTESRVPVSFNDSTKWETVKYYQINKDEAYIKKKDVVIKVHSDSDASLYLVCVLVGIFAGMLFVGIVIQ